MDENPHGAPTEINASSCMVSLSANVSRKTNDPFAPADPAYISEVHQRYRKQLEDCISIPDFLKLYWEYVINPYFQPLDVRDLNMLRYFLERGAGELAAEVSCIHGATSRVADANVRLHIGSPSLIGTTVVSADSRCAEQLADAGNTAAISPARLPGIFGRSQHTAAVIDLEIAQDGDADVDLHAAIALAERMGLAEDMNSSANKGQMMRQTESLRMVDATIASVYSAASDIKSAVFDLPINPCRAPRDMAIPYRYNGEQQQQREEREPLDDDSGLGTYQMDGTMRVLLQVGDKIAAVQFELDPSAAANTVQSAHTFSRSPGLSATGQILAQTGFASDGNTVSCQMSEVDEGNSGTGTIEWCPVTSDDARVAIAPNSRARLVSKPVAIHAPDSMAEEAESLRSATCTVAAVLGSSSSPVGPSKKRSRSSGSTSNAKVSEGNNVDDFVVIPDRLSFLDELPDCSLFLTPGKRGFFGDLFGDSGDLNLTLASLQEELIEQRSATSLRIAQLVARVQTSGEADDALQSLGLTLGDDERAILCGEETFEMDDGDALRLLPGPETISDFPRSYCSPILRGSLDYFFPPESWNARCSPLGVNGDLASMRRRADRDLVWERTICVVHEKISIWRELCKSIQRGTRDQEPNFNKRGADDAVPASWLIPVEGRQAVRQEIEEEDAVCSVCFDGKGTDFNPLVYCDGCDVAVHRCCYGLKHIAEGEWFCDICCHVKSVRLDPDLAFVPITDARCALCPIPGGALKRSTDGRWCHVMCALWCEGTWISNLSRMGPIELTETISAQLAAQSMSSGEELRCLLWRKPGYETILAKMQVIENETAMGDPIPLPRYDTTGSRIDASCLVCGKTSGRLVRCCADHCGRNFHPLCAWYQGYYLRATIPGSPDDTEEGFAVGSFVSEQSLLYLGGGQGMRYRIFCPDHTPGRVRSRKPTQQAQIRLQYRIPERSDLLHPVVAKANSSTNAMPFMGASTSAAVANASCAAGISGHSDGVPVIVKSNDKPKKRKDEKQKDGDKPKDLDCNMEMRNIDVRDTASNTSCSICFEPSYGLDNLLRCNSCYVVVHSNCIGWNGKPFLLSTLNPCTTNQNLPPMEGESTVRPVTDAISQKDGVIRGCSFTCEKCVDIDHVSKLTDSAAEAAERILVRLTSSNEAPCYDAFCALCKRFGGYLRRSKTNEWVHLVCSLLMPGVCFTPLGALLLPDCSRVERKRFVKMRCIICKKPGGACMACDTCEKNAMHPMCAIKSKCFTAWRPTAKGSLEGFLHCPEHSPLGYTFNDDTRKWIKLVDATASGTDGGFPAIPGTVPSDKKCAVDIPDMGDTSATLACSPTLVTSGSPADEAFAPPVLSISTKIESLARLLSNKPVKSQKLQQKPSKLAKMTKAAKIKKSCGASLSSKDTSGAMSAAAARSSGETLPSEPMKDYSYGSSAFSSVVSVEMSAFTARSLEFGPSNLRLRFRLSDIPGSERLKCVRGKAGIKDGVTGKQQTSRLISTSGNGLLASGASTTDSTTPDRSPNMSGSTSPVESIAGSDSEDIPIPHVREPTGRKFLDVLLGAAWSHLSMLEAATLDSWHPSINGSSGNNPPSRNQVHAGYFQIGPDMDAVKCRVLTSYLGLVSSARPPAGGSSWAGSSLMLDSADTPSHFLFDTLHLAAYSIPEAERISLDDIRYRVMIKAYYDFQFFVDDLLHFCSLAIKYIPGNDPASSEASVLAAAVDEISIQAAPFLSRQSVRRRRLQRELAGSFLGLARLDKKMQQVTDSQSSVSGNASRLSVSPHSFDDSSSRSGPGSLIHGPGNDTGTAIGVNSTAACSPPTDSFTRGFWVSTHGHCVCGLCGSTFAVPDLGDDIALPMPLPEEAQPFWKDPAIVSESGVIPTTDAQAIAAALGRRISSRTTSTTQHQTPNRWHHFTWFCPGCIHGKEEGMTFVGHSLWFYNHIRRTWTQGFITDFEPLFGMHQVTYNDGNWEYMDLVRRYVRYCFDSPTYTPTGEPCFAPVTVETSVATPVAQLLPILDDE
jgi:hypothetical protein